MNKNHVQLVKKKYILIGVSHKTLFTFNTRKEEITIYLKTFDIMHHHIWPLMGIMQEIYLTFAI